MDEHAYRRGHDLAHKITAAAALIIAICCVVLTIWLVTAQQNTKLYEADNVVCASQPFSIQCFERKAR